MRWRLLLKGPAHAGYVAARQEELRLVGEDDFGY